MRTDDKVVKLNATDFLHYRNASGNSYEIFDIVVNSERRKGHGRRMIQLMLDGLPTECRLVWAITRETNVVAHWFYNGLGFRLIAVLQDFYRCDAADEARTGKSFEHGLMYGLDPKERSIHGL